MPQFFLNIFYTLAPHIDIISNIVKLFAGMIGWLLIGFIVYFGVKFIISKRKKEVDYKIWLYRLIKTSLMLVIIILIPLIITVLLWTITLFN